VLSIAITLTGYLALRSLPVDQYPPITPPTVTVSCSYPGANTQVVADTVGAPIEQQVNGVEGMLYMSSTSGNDGSYSLTVTFDIGTNVKTALVLVQNRVALAVPQLPSEVQRQTINIRKKNPAILLIVNLFSNRPEHDALFLSNFATLNLKEEIARLPGVGDISLMGQKDYSIRAWLDPELLASRGMTAADVVNAIKNQSQDAAAGQIGQMPAGANQAFQLPIDTLGRLATPEDFGDIILNTAQANNMPSTAVVRLRDVGRVQLDTQQYDQACKVNGRPSAGIAVYQLPGTNALDTADGIRHMMKQLKAERFPEGMDYKIVYDTTPFIDESIFEVYKALAEATALVAIVVLLFLQSWRATLIPLAAVPVAIVGTFAVMAALGFSLNNLTLFGLVLAIGIVVDDAIVVVENVERWLEKGLPAREAARKAMDEVTGPVVAVALVLCAVFVPCAFLKGITGQFFRQFAVTIAVSTLLSAFNSLTLSPALAALLLRPHGAKKDPLTRLLNLGLGWFFWLFNRTFDKGTGAYASVVGRSLRLSAIVLVVYAGLLVLTWLAFTNAQSGFIPEQDKGYLLVHVQLPDAASQRRTQEVMAKLEAAAREVEGVDRTVAIAGQSLLLKANAPNFGSMYVILKKFENRRGPGLSSEAIRNTLHERFENQLRGEASVALFAPPPIDGLGNAGGFKLMVEDRGNLGQEELQKVAEEIADKGNATKGLHGLFNSTRANTPWLKLDIDRTRCRALDVQLSEVFNSLQVYLGSYYVNNFNEFGRSWQVNIQADTSFRSSVAEIKQIKVKSDSGKMVPLGSFAQARASSGPVMVLRYKMYSAAAINGAAAPGTSSGKALELMDKISKEAAARKRMGLDWTELAYLEDEAEKSGSAMGVFALAVVFVFLVLAAQYESWALPVAVILVVPMCLLCSIAGVIIAGMDVNVFTRIGFVVLIGLASKNAILIVEFAKQQHEDGKSRYDATVEACRLRLRPILMTSLAFILGVLPLVRAEGAGAEMRITLGTAVFAGMLGVTLFGIFLTPVFYYVIQALSDLRGVHKPTPPLASTPDLTHVPIGKH
jgi:hydrophobe/amphiphile efflux-1 (HAE1) family protein